MCRYNDFDESFNWISSKKRCIPLVSSISENCVKTQEEVPVKTVPVKTVQVKTVPVKTVQVKTVPAKKLRVDKVPIIVSKVMCKVDMTTSKSMTREQVIALQEIYQRGQVQDFNPEHVCEKTRRMVEELDPIRNKTFGKTCKKREINEDCAMRIWESFQTRKAIPLGQGNGIYIDMVGVYVARKSFSGTGIKKGDVFIFRQEPK
jgi:hypothetical protein